MKARCFRMRLAILILAIGVVSPLFAQYTDVAAVNDLGGPQEFARRRADLAKQLKTGYLILFARKTLPEAVHYREDNDFFYYTGISDPGAVLVMDVAKGTAILFEPQQAPRTRQVYGANVLSLAEEKRKEIGFETVLPLDVLDRLLARALSSDTDSWLRLTFADKADGARPETGGDYAEEYSHPYGDPTPGDRAAIKKLAERYPAARMRDATPFIDAMRNIKTPQEVAVLRKNGALSAEGIKQGIAHAHAGMYEYQIEAQAAFVFRNGGASGWAYPAIVGTGENINTWHYFNDRRQIQAGDLVVFDFAADYDHMAMDITRTFNVGGKFTEEQAKWYQADLESQKATIAMLKPGNTYEQASDAGKAVYAKYGIEKQWMGFPGHFVGLATHDVMRPQGAVKVGQVVTVEPIVEFPNKKMHFRVEDTILVTDSGPESLSAGVVKEMADVEKLVGSAK
ncbi:MAG TPA: Xaa-Pro peptidase family protein [Terriglobales bacterium]|nr:Xaa-Pro peptidase family protein [Terriglobales bacterium]